MTKEKIIKICPKCNKEFIVPRNNYIKLGRAKYCSNQCKNRKAPFDEFYFSGELTPEKLVTLGQFVVCTVFYGSPIIILISDEKTLNDIQTKLGMSFRYTITGSKLYKIRFKSDRIFNDLVRLGITGDRFYQDVPQDDLWEGLKSTHCYKEVGDICTFKTESSKISRWVQDKFNTEVVTKLFRLKEAGNKVCLYYINVWKKKTD